MRLNIQPSLQQMSALVVASKIFQNSEMGRLLRESQAKTREYHSPNECVHDEELDHWQEIQEWAMAQIKGCPSNIIKKYVARFVRPMYYIAYTWLADHQYLERSFLNLLCNGFICWRTDGMIDSTKTALKITRNENITVLIRFIMACIYFLEQEVFTLWYQIIGTEFHTQLMSMSDDAKGMAVRFWMTIIAERSRQNWREIARPFLTNFTPEWLVYKSRYSSIYHLYHLSPESRMLINTSCVVKPHQDDLLLYLQKFPEHKLPPLINEYIILVLDLVLKWPYQSLFNTFANQYLLPLSLHKFEFILHYIIRTRILQCLEDFDYVELFKVFWNSSPVAHRDYIRGKEGWREIIEIITSDDAENAKRSWVKNLSRSFFALPRL